MNTVSLKTLRSTPIRAVMTAAFLLSSVLLGNASEIFYSVGFDTPPNQVGQPPVTGLGASTPSSIVFGSPTVVSSFGHLTQQPLLFAGIGHQQIQFDLGKGVPDYFLDFDFETHNLNPSLFAFATLCDTPPVQNFYLHGLGYIQGPPFSSPQLPGWSDDQLHHMHIDVNLAQNQWTLQLDNGIPATGLFSSYSGDVLSIRMDLSTWRAGTPDDSDVQIAIDNIVIGTSVPEPSLSSLCAIGLLVGIRALKAKHRSARI